MTTLKTEESIDYQVKLAWYNIFKMYNQIAGNYGLTQATGLALMSIDDEGGTPATQVATRMGMEPTSLSRLLRSMEKNDFIYSKRGNVDARRVLIFLTPLGLKKKRMAKIIVKSFNEQLLESIPEESVETFFKVLKKINKHTKKFKEEFFKKREYEEEDK